MVTVHYSIEDFLFHFLSFHTHLNLQIFFSKLYLHTQRHCITQLQGILCVHICAYTYSPSSHPLPPQQGRTGIDTTKKWH